VYEISLESSEAVNCSRRTPLGAQNAPAGFLGARKPISGRTAFLIGGYDMQKRQWSAMSKNEKLDYLHECIQATDAEMTRISSEVSKAVMRIEEIEKSGKKKPKRVKARKSA
jgi:hypothetical protein